MIDWSSRADGIGSHIDIEAFSEQVMDRLTDTDMCLNAADQDFPNSAIAPARENLAAFAAAKSRLGRNGAEQRG